MREKLREKFFSLDPSLLISGRLTPVHAEPLRCTLRDIKRGGGGDVI